MAAGAADDDYAWTETLMKELTTGLGDRAPRGLFQAVSFHYYTMSGTWSQKGSATAFTDDEYWTTIRRAQHVRELIAGHAAVMDAYDPTKQVGLALDEWGTWWDVEPGTNPGFLFQQNALRDALVASVHLDAFHDHADRLRLANIAQTVNVLQAMVLTDGDRLVRTPTFHVFAMSRGHHDAESLPVRVVSRRSHRVDDVEVPTVSASASIRDGHALLSCTNLDPGAGATVRIDLRGRAVSEPRGTVLTAGSVRDHNTADEPDAVTPRPFEAVRLTGTTLELELPPASFATIDLALG